MKTLTKGWFRLWLSFSVVWWLVSLIVIIVLFFTDSYHKIEEGTEGAVDAVRLMSEAEEGETWASMAKDNPDIDFGFRARVYFQWPWFLLSIIPAVLPPFAIYLFSKGCYWIYKGFGVDETTKPPRL